MLWGEIAVDRPAAAEPGGQVGQGYPSQKVQIDAWPLGAQGGPEGLLADRSRDTGTGQGVGQRIGKLQKEAVQGGIVILDAGAAPGG